MQSLPPPVSDLDINSLEQMLNAKNVTNSYKFYWFAAILDKVSECRSATMDFR